MAELTAHPGVRAIVEDVETRVSRGDLTASLAAQQLLQAFNRE